MTDIFISYKREDQEIAGKLAGILEVAGWTVWWDPRLRAGEHFDDVIEQAIDRATLVIVLWSQSSVRSRYVKDEASYALKQGKLVPVALDRQDSPFRFQSLHTVSLDHWDGRSDDPALMSLLADLSARTGRAASCVEEAGLSADSGDVASVPTGTPGPVVDARSAPAKVVRVGRKTLPWTLAGLLVLGAAVTLMSHYQRNAQESSRPPRLQLDALSPSPGAIGTPTTAPVLVALDQRMGEVAPAAISVSGSSSGRRRGSYESTGGNSVQLVPAPAFHAGEQVEVSVTRDIVNRAGLAMEQAFVYRFRAATAPRDTVVLEPGATYRPPAARTLAVGDLDGDGHLDLAVGGGSDVKPVNRVMLFFGDGAGAFSEGTTFTVGSYKTKALGYKLGVSTADMDGDGRLDVLVTHSDDAAAWVLRNIASRAGDRGREAFTLAGPFPLGRSPQHVQIGDLDGDGDLDLVSADYWDSSVPILRGNGSGGFHPRRATKLEFSPIAVVMNDFNRDGRLDVAALGSDAGRLLLNAGVDEKGAVTFDDAGPVGEGGTLGDSGDFDGDGVPDLLVHYGRTINRKWRYSLQLFGTSGGSATESGSRPTFELDLKTRASGLAVADFNGDSALDLAVSADGAVALSFGNGRGDFESGPRVKLARAAAQAAGDFDGDGDLDLAVINGCTEQDCLDTFTVLLNVAR